VLPSVTTAPAIGVLLPAVSPTPIAVAPLRTLKKAPTLVDVFDRVIEQCTRILFDEEDGVIDTEPPVKSTKEEEVVVNVSVLVVETT
jgi:hypothetical protein